MGGEPAQDATVTMSLFWNCPIRRHPDFGGRCLAFGLAVGTFLSFHWGRGGVCRTAFLFLSSFLRVLLFCVNYGGGEGSTNWIGVGGLGRPPHTRFMQRWVAGCTKKAW